MRLSPWTALRSPPTKRIQDTSLFRAGDRQAPPASTAWNAGIAIGMQQTILTACSTVLHPRPPASTVSTILRGDALDAPSDLCHPLGTSISAPRSYSRTSGVPPSALPIPMPASARPRPILSPPSPLSGHPPSVSTAVGQWPRPCAMNPGRWLTPMAISPKQGCTATFAPTSTPNFSAPPPRPISCGPPHPEAPPQTLTARSARAGQIRESPPQKTCPHCGAAGRNEEDRDGAMPAIDSIPSGDPSTSLPPFCGLAPLSPPATAPPPSSSRPRMSGPRMGVPQRTSFDGNPYLMENGSSRKSFRLQPPQSPSATNLSNGRAVRHPKGLLSGTAGPEPAACAAFRPHHCAATGAPDGGAHDRATAMQVERLLIPTRPRPGSLVSTDRRPDMSEHRRSCERASSGHLQPPWIDPKPNRWATKWGQPPNPAASRFPRMGAWQRRLGHHHQCGSGKGRLAA